MTNPQLIRGKISSRNILEPNRDEKMSLAVTPPRTCACHPSGKKATTWIYFNDLPSTDCTQWTDDRRITKRQTSVRYSETAAEGWELEGEAHSGGLARLGLGLGEYLTALCRNLLARQVFSLTRGGLRSSSNQLPRSWRQSEWSAVAHPWREREN